LAAAEAPAPVEQPFKPVFTLLEKTVLMMQLQWWHFLGPLLGACLMTAAFSRGYSLPSRATVLWILAAGPWAILALTLLGEVLWSKRFERRMRRGVASRLNPTLPPTFAGIHPGRGVRYTEGYADWDFGFVSLEGDWLCYRGEKVRFAIPRQDVREVSIVKGPPNWVRERRVEVVFPGGAFTMNVSYANPTMAIARRTAKWIKIGYPNVIGGAFRCQTRTASAAAELARGRHFPVGRVLVSVQDLHQAAAGRTFGGDGRIQLRAGCRDHHTGGSDGRVLADPACYHLAHSAASGCCGCSRDESVGRNGTYLMAVVPCGRAVSSELHPHDP
jgi:hypothetical protein